MDLQADRVMLGFVVPLELPERRETLERMVHLARLVLQVLRDWLVSAVLLVSPDSVAREVSPVCLDLLVSLESKELLVVLETVDPLDLLDHLD